MPLASQRLTRARAYLLAVAALVTAGSGAGCTPPPHVNDASSSDLPSTEGSTDTPSASSSASSAPSPASSPPLSASPDPVQAPAAASGKKGAAPAAQTEAPTTKKAISLPLTGLSWGQSPKQVAAAIDKIYDEDYRPLYQATSPGVKMKALDAQIAEDKDQFRRSRIDFGKLPTGVDASPLKSEYTYNNKEALYILTRKGATTNFFFIQDRLWKIIVEYKLMEGGSLGKTYQDAVVKLATLYGVPGRVLPPDDKRFVYEVEWKDGSSHVRAIQRGDTGMGLAYEDNATLMSLASMRPNKPVEDNGIDPSVAAIMRGSGDPGPPPPPKKDDKKTPKK